MKKIIVLAFITLVAFTTQAQTKKSKNAKYVTEINGNCGLCQKRIQKAALSVKGVKYANWDIPTHQLSVILNEEKSSIFELKKAIAKSGHDSKEIKATKEDYDKLHSCCLYQRD